MLGTLMLPYHVTLVPQYVLFLNFGWVNTFLPLDRAEVPRGRRLLRLPDGAVLPRHPARDRRGGDHGRLRAVADLLEDHAAALDAGAGDRGDLLLHLDLRRLPRAADLPQRHAHLHRAAGAPRLRRLRRAASRSTARSSPCRRCRSSRSSSSSSPSSASSSAASRSAPSSAESTNARSLRLRRLRHQPQPHLRPGRRHARRRLPADGLLRARGRPRRRLRQGLPAGRGASPTSARSSTTPPSASSSAPASPATAPAMALRAMRAGKDVMVDKPGCTTEAQLAELRARAGRDRPHLLDLLLRALPAARDRRRRRASSPKAPSAGSSTPSASGPHRIGLHARARLVLGHRARRRDPRRHRLAPVRAVPALHRLDLGPHPLRASRPTSTTPTRPAGTTTATPPSPPTTPPASSASTG